MAAYRFRNERTERPPGDKTFRRYEEMCSNKDENMEMPEDIDDLSHTVEINSVSPIWDHFQDTDKEAKCATCNYCNDTLSYETTTRNLRDHLKETHSDMYEELLANGLRDISSDRDSVASAAPSESRRRRRSSAYSVNSEISLQSEFENKRHRKLTSTMWAYFDVTDEEAKLATCKFCQHSISYKSTLMNLRSHLKKAHSDVFEEMCASGDKYVKRELKVVVGVSGRRSLRKNASPLWNHFQNIDRVAKCAICNHCNNTFSYKSTTGNLTAHLQKKHSDMYEELLGNRLRDGSSDRDSVASDAPSGSGRRRRSSACSVNSEMSLQSKSKFKRRRRKIISAMWAHFNVTDEEAKLATCKYCTYSISYKSTLMNLRSHLKKSHSDAFEEMCASGDKYVRRELEVVVGVSGRRSLRKNASPLWNHFQAIDRVAKCAVCNHCNNTFSYKTSTGNLTAHLQKKHSDMYEELLANRLRDDRSDRDSVASATPSRSGRRRRSSACSADSELSLQSESKFKRRCRNPTSAMWAHFDVTDEKAKIATCKYCQHSISYKNTLTKLRYHLKKSHIDAFEEMCASGDKYVKRELEVVVDMSGRHSLRTKASPIWNHFQNIDSVAKFAICNHCSNTFSYKTTTGNLRMHLKNKHRDEYEEFLAHKLLDCGSDGDNVALDGPSGPRRRSGMHAKSEWSLQSARSEKRRNHPAMKVASVWTHFDIADSYSKLATCKYCEKEYSYKDTTSALHNHLRQMHLDTYEEMCDDYMKREPKVHQDLDSRRSRTKVSPIWSHFDDDDRAAKTALCNYCNNKFSYKSSTGNLVNHLRTKHSEAYEELLAKRLRGDSSDGESAETAAPSKSPRRMSAWSVESDKSPSMKSDPFFVGVPHHLRDIMKIGFLGGGRLAYALASGFISAGLAKGEEITASVHPSDLASAEAFKSLGATALFENVPVVERSDVVVVSVKPGVVSQVLKEVRGSPACKDKLFISVAMGITIKSIESSLPQHARVVRVMPNTPALVQKGAAVYSLGSRATPEDAQLTQQLLESVGTCEQVPEHSMDAVTALSGSGPAYVYMMIEAMAEGGVRAGLPRDLALRLASQTTLGAAAMVQEGGHPAQLKDNVTSPAGSTAEGTYHLEQKGFRAAIIGAVTAAAERCKVVSSQTE